MAYSPSDTVSPVTLLQDLLAISLTAINLLRPLYDPAGELIDFAPEYFNPAAQRMTGLFTERPTGTARTLFPDIFTNGIFAFYRQVFESGEAGQFAVNYQADRLDNYFRVAAQRSGELLIVSFTDTADQDRSAVELALRESQAAEKAARAEAEAQRQRFYETLMALPAQVATYHGPHHTYNFVNAAYRRYFPTQALPGRSLRQVLPEAERQGVLAVMDRVYQTGEPSYQQELEVWLDFEGSGQPRQLFLNLLFHPLRDAQGRIDGLLDFSYDVTEQVQARQQLEQLNAELEERVRERTAQVREQERLLRHTLEGVPAAIATLSGPEHRFSFANARYQHLVGNRAATGQTVAEALPEVVEQGVVELLDRVYQTGEPFIGQGVMIMLEQPPGPPHQYYYDLTYLPLRDGQSQVQGILVFAVEVTEQVRTRRQTALLQADLLVATQRQVQEREAQRGELQRLFEQAPVAIAVFHGPQYVVELANSSVCALWGRTQQQALGTPLFELLPEVAGQGFEQLLDGVRTTGVPFVAHELPSFIDRHGRRETVYWNFVYAPLREADGTIERVTVVATEGTEQVLARQQVQTLNEELAARNQELHESNTQLTRTNVDLDNFIYTASHDLKAPITNIEGLLLALEHELPAAARLGYVPQMLTMMQESIERFQQTISHLTDLSRLQKEHSHESNAVALAPVVEAVRLDLAPLLAQTQGQLTVSIPQALTVTFAEKNLRSVVYNLLSNAFKYRHPDRTPEVQLRAWPADDYTVLAVQDNGLGLDLSQGQEKLFAMFQRLHTHVEGTGVGLYMVKRILENVGGRIEVASQLGQGSTFHVYFPH